MINISNNSSNLFGVLFAALRNGQQVLVATTAPAKVSINWGMSF